MVWLCRPGLRNNPCEIRLDDTLQSFTGKDRVVKHRRQPSRKRKIDCFYVYPTVSNQVTPTATKAKDPEIRSIAKYQAAGFSSQCRMFAPVYRQVTLVGLPTIALGPLGVPSVGYTDVVKAFKRYLARHNKGRGFVLIGHSQGTLMLRKLIREYVDPNRELRRRLVGAVLLGGNVTVAQGKRRGGDFAHVPVCRRSGQSGCVVAYSTSSMDPGPVSFFGNSSFDVLSQATGLPTGSAYEVACTDPDVLSGRSGPSAVRVPSEPFAPGVIALSIATTVHGDVPTARTTWVTPPDRFRGRCRTINGAHVYRYDPVGDSRRPAEVPPTWGTHLIDMNLGLGKLVRIVRLQKKDWLARH